MQRKKGEKQSYVDIHATLAAQSSYMIVEREIWLARAPLVL